MALIKIKVGMEAFLRNPPAVMKPNVDKLTEKTSTKATENNKKESQLRKCINDKLKR